ncbi:MAG: Uma2 family endonuclease [Thermomicrobiales bacterium]
MFFRLYATPLAAIIEEAAMVATRLSIAEFEATCGDARVELVDGEVVPLSPSSFGSSNTSWMIGYLLGLYVVPRRLGSLSNAEAGFVIFPDRPTVLAPDVAFVRADRAPQGAARRHFANLAPDLVVEVNSPSDRPRDIASKVTMYQEAGVLLVWVVDPPALTVTVHALGQQPVTLGVDDELDGGEVLPGFRVTVAEVFA